MLVVFNVVGIGMLAAAFGIAYVIGLAVGATAEAPLMVAGGALLLIIDLAYRTSRRTAVAESWLMPLMYPKRGGQLFWIPLWLWGLVWLNIGGFRILTASN